jgi:hypothetical protein
MVAPPVYTGVSCTYRSLTSDGATITALAVAGSLTVLSTSMSTRTVSPSGVTLSTCPTFTPRTRTSLAS